MTSNRKNGNKSKGPVKNRKAKLAPGTKPNFKNTGNLRYPFRQIDNKFHLELKHILGGVSLISLLAAFEVFSIPAANGIVDILNLTNYLAGMTWLFVAAISGGVALVLHEEES